MAGYAEYERIDDPNGHDSSRLVTVTRSRLRFGLLPVLVGILAGFGGISFSVPGGHASFAQLAADRSLAAQESEEARWLAVRYATEAEYHFLEAIRNEERAIKIDPMKDITGMSRNRVLSEANAHWSRVFDLRTRAQLSRIEASQRATR